MPKKEMKFQIRISEKEKEEWVKAAKRQKFPSVSQFIRYVISEYIEKNSVNLERNSNISEEDELNRNNELLKELIEQRAEYMGQITEILSEMRKSKKITIEYKVKGKILKLLEKHKYKSEDIAEIFNLSESEVLIILNDLLEQNIVKLNKNFEYEMLNNVNNE